jgi:acyl-CoA thioesterase FadM
MRLHDRVEATCTIAEMGKSSITFKQTIESPGGQQVYSESDVVLVCVDKTTMRPKYMPNFLREKLS